MNHEEGEPYPEGFPESQEGIKSFLKRELLANKPKGIDGNHDGCPGWPKNLFVQKEEDQIRFLKKRMATTESRKEYYTAMLFLLHRVPDNELLIPFESAGDSRVCSTNNGSRFDTNSTPKTPTIDTIGEVGK